MNRSQRQAVDEIFLSREKIVGLDGVAGAGKTTTLSVVREGAEAQGYKVEGFAPTSRAAHKLAEAGMETSTLQRHLAKGTQPETAEKRLYVLDESSLASTRQMHEFIERLHRNDRVLLVGDSRQHEAVEAGRPFAQLQEAGMRTATLNDIVRQRDPELKQVVEQLASGHVRAAVESLDQQGRVHQVKGHDERIGAIAREYAKSPTGTLVVSPDNRSRSEINQRIHDELQSRGLVNRQEHPVRTLVPRQEMTGADRSWAQQYQADDILRYSRTSKETGIEKGEYSRVLAVNAQANTLTVERGNGEQTTYDPRRQVGVSVYREDEKRFSVGDRIQFTAPSQELKIANRDLGTVESIGRDGTMRLRLDDERKVEFNPQQHPHVDHGYAVTSYSSQGQTAERVLVNVDTELAAKDLLNTRFAYVSVSRAASDARIYTNDATTLAERLNTDISKTSAVRLNDPNGETHQRPDPSVQPKENTMTNIREQNPEEQRQQPQSELTPISVTLQSITETDQRHYAPLHVALPNENGGYEWRRETGDIQSYRHKESTSWLHIDPQGQFYDRHAQPIGREQALEYAGHVVLAANEISNSQSPGRGSAGTEQGLSL